MFGNQEKSYLENLVRQGRNGFKAFAYEAVTVTGTIAYLAPPATAKYALMKLVSDATGNCANTAGLSRKELRRLSRAHKLWRIARKKLLQHKEFKHERESIG